ncbi:MULTISPECIES: sensor domain-containing diguanylate cyclase [Methylobacterium]|uniref:diguanylate cyclase n=2 Tax=Methylobacterium TaxID=407 RepID=A0A0C6FAJ4_9HYPH|nr:diguanylate cyclase [Methylobacterium aquaticum]BAQ45468.1 diguanylate cyclase [Methylobacterium aquaticum]
MSVRLISLLPRGLRSARTWAALGVVAPLGMVAVCGAMLADMRRDAWDKAARTSWNLLQVIERDVDRNIEIIDLALQGVIENLQIYDLEEVKPHFRQRVLFDRAVNAKDLGVMLVLDEHGNAIYDAAGWPARRLNNADREYFKAHKADPDLGLHISRPVISHLAGKPVIVLSRRVAMADGSFNGIVLGSLSLSYFDRMFERIRLGPGSTIALFLADGTRIVRHPEPNEELAPNFASSPNVQRFLREGTGSFVGVTPSDGVERFYTFTRVGSLPLYLSVALSTREIEAGWRTKAIGIGLVVLALCALAVGLSVLVAGELRRRNAAEAELALLSRTDPLTGLPNRRAFDETFERAFAEARRRSSPLGLLVVDADHFKRFNDRHGHEGGDRVLVALAGALSASARRPGDLVARLGGEEFAVLLPDTDAEGAARVAENVHEAVGCLLVEARDGPVGRITVSIGLAFGMPRAGGEAAELLRLADAALYEAKAAGRDRTCYALMADDAVPGEIASWMDPASDEAAPAHRGAAGRQPGGPLPFPLAS